MMIALDWMKSGNVMKVRFCPIIGLNTYRDYWNERLSFTSSMVRQTHLLHSSYLVSESFLIHYLT